MFAEFMKLGAGSAPL